MKNKILLTGFVILSLLSFQAHTVDWPGTGACSGSLNACINAQADGGLVTVNTSFALGLGTLIINKGFTLRAGIGFHPVLRNVTINVTVPDNKKVTISGFELQENSYIDATIGSEAELNITANNWSDPDSIAGQFEGIQVSSNISPGNESIVNIIGNNIIGEGANSFFGFIDIAHITTGVLKANIIDNHITVLDINSESFMSEGIYLFNGSTGRIDSQIVANEIRGSLYPIRLQQSISGTLRVGVVSNLLTGVIDANNVVNASSLRSSIYSTVLNGNFTGIFGNNTIDGINGVGFNFSNHTTTGSSSIQILNNIVVNTAAGYVGPASGDSVSEASLGNNIFFNHGTITGLSLVASDINAPPAFIQEGINYALKDSSPAIDKASFLTSALYTIGFMAGSPRIDADGLRRYKGAKIDAGAYEWGDRHIFHKSNASGNQISQPIADNDLNSNPDATTIVTQVWNYENSAGVDNDNPIGIYRFSNQWRIFNENFVTMPTNAKFHVFYPYGDAGGAAIGGLSNWTAAAGATGFELNNTILNDNRDAGVFVTNLWDGSAGGIYNPYPLEIGYKNNGKWYLGNADGINMTTGAKFMTYQQDGSRNVFKHYVTSNNIVLGYITIIDHPLLNGNPCALPTVTQSTSWFFGPLFEQNPHNIGVYYSAGRWRIFNQDSADIDIDIGAGPVIGGVFNVMVNPQQVYECNDIIFKNGFD